MRAAYAHTALAWIAARSRPSCAPAAPPPAIRATRSSRSTARSISSTMPWTRPSPSRSPRATGRSCRPRCAGASPTSSATSATSPPRSTTCCSSRCRARHPTSAASLINSTVGILGVFDVASRLGLEKHDEDFGQTLGHWGVGPGPYRDAAACSARAPSRHGRAGRRLLHRPRVLSVQPSPGDLHRVRHARRSTCAPTCWRSRACSTRRRTRPVCVPARRVPAAPAQPDLRRQPAGDAERARAQPRRKTLKEMEEELDLDEPDAGTSPAAPARRDGSRSPVDGRRSRERPPRAHARGELYFRFRPRAQPQRARE